MSFGITCPFCGKKLEIECYRTKKKNGDGNVRVVVFCGNDHCKVKPCSDDTTPSEAIKEAELFGKINL